MASNEELGMRVEGNTLIVTSCRRCGMGANKRCGGCKTAHYCSVECQREDWSEHRVPCKKIQSGEYQPRKITLSANDYVQMMLNDPTFAASQLRGETPEGFAEMMNEFKELSKKMNPQVK